jgi:GNAT superfamily N-acetyltransferase
MPGAPPTIRLSRPDERDALLAFIEQMGFNPRDAVTWDALGMFAMTAWLGDRLIGAIPIEPRPLRVAPDRVVWAAHETVVAVHPDYRGGGLGSAMQAALTECRFPSPAGAGVPSLLSVYREDPASPAYRWYLKNHICPATRIASWFCDHSVAPKDSVPTTPYAPTDPAVPWSVLADIWRTARQGHAGFVERAGRPLQTWLAVHPYRHRYRFELLIRTDAPAGYVLLGVGRMHSPVERLDILELVTTGSPADAARLLGAVQHHAAGRPIRWPLAVGDPMTEIARGAGFESRWSFDLLIRPLDPALALPPAVTESWIYAGIDYI